MVKYSRIIVLLILTLSVFTVGCSDNNSLKKISEPSRFSATSDEVAPTINPEAVEDSENVNGMHFTTSLSEFTRQYNSIMMDSGGTDYIYSENWTKSGDVQADTNGVKYQLYYYNAELFTITVAVETQTNKIMNVGCGTTMNTFVNQDQENSNQVLHACAIMAAAVGKFDDGSLDVLQDIFYHTIYSDTSSIWYEGCVFCLETNVDKSDGEKSTMLFRIFPISNSLKSEWELIDYADLTQ
jgi:hypothetical protein